MMSSGLIPGTSIFKVKPDSVSWIVLLGSVGDGIRVAEGLVCRPGRARLVPVVRNRDTTSNLKEDSGLDRRAWAGDSRFSLDVPEQDGIVFQDGNRVP
jgi:hypothetical protein